jgi:hypothetical protein
VGFAPGRPLKLNVRTLVHFLLRAMKKLILIALVAVVGWQVYTKYQAKQLAYANALEETSAADVRSPVRSEPDTSPPSNFKCDGRTYCSQMTSCEEATFFLRNCPGVKMDGNNDGVPCEKQWCK